jgi:hypothetical protein
MNFKPKMDLWFTTITVALLIFFTYAHINPKDLWITLSSIFLGVTVVLLSAGWIPQVREKIKGYYSNKASEINKEISRIRRQQSKMTSVREIFNLDNDIVSLRGELLGVQPSRFGRCCIYSIIWFAITLAVFYLSLGNFIGLSDMVLGTATFFIGLFYLFEMLYVTAIHLED